jgi:hypothetical protein
MEVARSTETSEHTYCPVRYNTQKSIIRATPTMKACKGS